MWGTYVAQTQASAEMTWFPLPNHYGSLGGSGVYSLCKMALIAPLRVVVGVVETTVDLNRCQ